MHVTNVSKIHGLIAKRGQPMRTPDIADALQLDIKTVSATIQHMLHSGQLTGCKVQRPGQRECWEVRPAAAAGTPAAKPVSFGRQYPAEPAPVAARAPAEPAPAAPAPAPVAPVPAVAPPRLPAQLVLGCEARDRVTGMVGIVVGRSDMLYDGIRFGLTPRAADRVAGIVWLPAARVEWVGAGMAREVA